MEFAGAVVVVGSVVVAFWVDVVVLIDVDVVVVAICGVVVAVVVGAVVDVALGVVGDSPFFASKAFIDAGVKISLSSFVDIDKQAASIRIDSGFGGPTGGAQNTSIFSTVFVCNEETHPVGDRPILFGSERGCCG